LEIVVGAFHARFSTSSFHEEWFAGSFLLQDFSPNSEAENADERLTVRARRSRRRKPREQKCARTTASRAVVEFSHSLRRAALPEGG